MPLGRRVVGTLGASRAAVTTGFFRSTPAGPSTSSTPLPGHLSGDTSAFGEDAVLITRPYPNHYAAAAPHASLGHSPRAFSTWPSRAFSTSSPRSFSTAVSEPFLDARAPGSSVFPSVQVPEPLEVRCGKPGTGPGGAEVHFVAGPADLAPGGAGADLAPYLDRHRIDRTGLAKLGSALTLYDPIGSGMDYVLVGAGIPGQSGGSDKEGTDSKEVGGCDAGVGRETAPLTPSQFKKIVRAALDELSARKITSATVLSHDVERGKSCHALLADSQAVAQEFLVGAYKFEALKKKAHREAGTKKEAGEEDEAEDKKTTLYFPSLKEPEATLARAVAVGQNYARTLKNLPANVCGTEYMRREMLDLVGGERTGDTSNAKIGLFSNFICLDDVEMRGLGMGCITAVGQGSSMPSYICAVEYDGRPAKAARKADAGAGSDENSSDGDSSDTIVLLGKGVVHDSGGLCLKPGASMPGMKMDMGGAAGVLGAMRALRELGAGGALPLRVVGVLALVENSISSTCYRPGDVLKSMNGLTVEVGNTDAEGRLALCDALTWIESVYGRGGAGCGSGGAGKDTDSSSVEDKGRGASGEDTKGDGSTTADAASRKRSKPPIVIDMATLTGAMVIALGSELTGAFANDANLLNDLHEAGLRSRDRLWKMPLEEVKSEYLELLKSDVADMNNIGGAAAGSVTAALFLSRFAEKLRWAHLDIAGTAMGGNIEKGTATGRPVPLLVEYLRAKAAERT